MKILRKLRALFSKEKLDVEMSEEMRAHLDLQTHENIARGMAADEARYAAHRSFGGIEQIKERARDVRRWIWLEQMMQDVRFAARALRKNPGFTIVAVLTLALGVGANTAMFSVIEGVLLRPLPYHESEHLTAIRAFGSYGNARRANLSISDPSFLAWRTGSSSFAALAAYQTASPTNLVIGGEAERVTMGRVSAGFFEVFGTGPVLGRAFSPDDERPGESRAVILSHELWTGRFAADPAVIGRGVRLDGALHTVIGIMRPGFEFLERIDAWAPATISSANRNLSSLRVLGRLKPGVTLEQARADLFRLRDLETSNAANLEITVTSLLDDIIGGSRRGLAVMFGAVGLVLLIACANVGGLLLVRATVRRREFAMRAALGASRRSLIRLMLVESLILALLGAGAGALLAMWGCQGLSAILPANLPRAELITVNLRVLGFTLATALGAGALFGIVPAFRGSQLQLTDALKSGRSGTVGGAGKQRIHRVLVVTQIALALVLLIGAGLMVRSLTHLLRIDLGFRRENVLTFDVQLPAQRTAAQMKAFHRQTVGRLAALPGVTAAGFGSVPPLGSMWLEGSFAVEGEPPPKNVNASKPVVGPGYFSAMGIAFRRGRVFGAQDDESAPKVAIVNESFARRFWPERDPIGRRVTVGKGVWLTVVGVAADVKERGLTAPVPLTIYLPYAQVEPTVWLSRMTFAVRTGAGATIGAKAMLGEVHAVDQEVPVHGMRTMEQLVAAAVSRPRFEAWLFGIFSVMALVLAAVGIYGVMSYTVAQRTSEFGLRMALGASRSDVLRLVFREGMTQVAAGLCVGLAGAVAATRLIADQLYGVEATDPGTFVVLSILLATVGLIACGLPARRATKADPMVALRCE